MSNALTISINNTKVIEGTIWQFTGNSKEFSATFEGKAVRAECEYKGPYAGMQCQIFIGNERATTLRF